MIEADDDRAVASAMANVQLVLYGGVIGRDAKIRGTLAPGKLADFTGWPADPLSCPVEELAGLLPVLTVVGGRVRHHVHGLAVRGGTLRPVAISS